MADSKRATAVLGVQIKSGDVVLLLKSDSSEVFEVRLAAPIIGGIAVALIGLGNKLATANTEGVVGQVMQLTAAIPGRGPKGQAVLDLVLEGTLHFPVTFSDAAIPIFQSALATLQDSSTGFGPTPSRGH